jgi:hypothetical protein
MNSWYSAVASRARHRCEYCLAPEVIFNTVFEIDHIVPQARGGPSTLDNFALACRGCNLRKRDHQGQKKQSGEFVLIFNPRKHQWSECFEIDLIEGVILGRNSIGSTTVELLDLNHPAQIIARQYWIEMKLYP